MRFFDAIRFTLKNLWRQRLRSSLTIFAIVIGALSVITMISLVLGASRVFLQQIESAGALTIVTVSANKDASADDILNGHNSNSADQPKLDDAAVGKVKAIPHVLDATGVVYVYPLQVFSLKGDSSGKKYTVNPQAYQPGPASDKQLEAGRNLLPSDGSGKVLVDAGMAAKIGYKDNPQDLVGKTLVFTTPKGYTGEGATILNPMQANGQFDSDIQKQQQALMTTLDATVVGVAETGPFGDSGTVYVPLAWARGVMTNRYYGLSQEEQDAWNASQKTCQNTGRCPQPPASHLVTQSQLDQQGYNDIVAKVDSSDSAAAVAADVKKLGYGAATAQDFLDTVMKLFRTIGAVFGAIGAVSLLVAAIGVINTMVMATLERTREIGVMRAVGATRGNVSGLFTLEAALLGFWGGAVGVLAGIGLSKVANIFVNKQLAAQHIGATNIISLPWWLIVSVIGATTLIGMLAGLYPAMRASRLNPVDALRYE